MGAWKQCRASRLGKNRVPARQGEKIRKPPVLAQKTSGQTKKKLQNFHTFSPPHLWGVNKSDETTATTRVHCTRGGVGGVRLRDGRGGKEGGDGRLCMTTGQVCGSAHVVELGPASRPPRAGLRDERSTPDLTGENDTNRPHGGSHPTRPLFAGCR